MPWLRARASNLAAPALLAQSRGLELDAIQDSALGPWALALLLVHIAGSTGPSQEGKAGLVCRVVAVAVLRTAQMPISWQH